MAQCNLVLPYPIKAPALLQLWLVPVRVTRSHLSCHSQTGSLGRCSTWSWSGQNSRDKYTHLSVWMHTCTYVFHILLINIYLKHCKIWIKPLFLVNRHILHILLKFWAETLRNGTTQQNSFADYTLGQPPKDMLLWQEKQCHTYRGLPRSCQGTSPLNTSQFVFGAGCAEQPSLLSSMLNTDSAKNSWRMHICPETTHNRD